MSICKTVGIVTANSANEDEKARNDHGVATEVQRDLGQPSRIPSKSRRSPR